MGACLGLDMGEKRIGIAVSDELEFLATPLKTLEFKSRKSVLSELEALVHHYQIHTIVVGFPKSLKGEIGIAARKIKEHVDWFEQHLKLAWILWDERLTTQEVERVLIEADVRRDKRKEVRDKLAAQRILQNYLDFKRARQSLNPKGIT